MVLPIEFGSLNRSFRLGFARSGSRKIGDDGVNLWFTLSLALTILDLTEAE